MKIVSKAIRIAVAGGMIGGMMSIGAGSADAVVTTVASCSGMKGVASLKSTTVGDGITDKDNQNVSVSAKGIDNTAGPTFGSCTFTAGLSTPDSNKPAILGYSGVHQIAKWSLKLYSPEADCNVADTGDLTEWPLAGGFGMEFTDQTLALKNQKLSGTVIIDGFTDPDNDPLTPSDVVEAHGLVSKGVAAGADIVQESMFDPIFKDSTQLTETPAIKYQFDLAGAIGCTTPAPGDANILGALVGDDGGTSALLALPVGGMDLTIGS